MPGLDFDPRSKGHGQLFNFSGPLLFSDFQSRVLNEVISRFCALRCLDIHTGKQTLQNSYQAPCQQVWSVSMWHTCSVEERTGCEWSGGMTEGKNFRGSGQGTVARAKVWQPQRQPGHEWVVGSILSQRCIFTSLPTSSVSLFTPHIWYNPSYHFSFSPYQGEAHRDLPCLHISFL